MVGFISRVIFVRESVGTHTSEILGYDVDIKRVVLIFSKIVNSTCLLYGDTVSRGAIVFTILV